MSFKGLTAYELLKEQDLNDIHSKGYILRHKKSGARLALVSNDDDNKVFYIGFRTPPEDETGVPHIIEHTVLCGSDKFPVKDPFVELVKGSLNTFLNAMTYPDKTLYPVASYNDKDFKNLMDVYMDAVLHPNILKYQEIFKQEGWHYELEEKDGPVTINGVVYNEMKGAYSSPEEMLQTAIMKALFPGNTYSKDSGGNPEFIPELTYEAYIDFYKKYYHPTNSYIYLYGDFDIVERLEWLDKEYLSEYDRITIDSEIHPVDDFDEVKNITGKYPISSDESEEDNTYLSYSKVIGHVLDRKLCQAFEMLDYALVSAPGAPVRQALIDAGIGQDVYASFEEGICQPAYHIVAKNANACDKERFVQIIEDTLKKIVEDGVNEESIKAAINSAEFRFREADYGSYPKGLLYGLLCMDSWLFDDMEPFMYVELLDTFEFLKAQIGTGYYEELIQKYILDNTHGVVVSLEPEKGLTQQMEDALEAKLAAYKATLSEAELDAMVEETKHLKEYQETPSPEEDLAKIPMLEREDLRKEVLPYSNIEETVAGVPVVRHDYETNGIDYISLYFDARDIAKEDIPYLGFLKNILAYMDTETYAYADLANAINIHTGGLATGLYPIAEAHNPEHLLVPYEFRVKALEDNLSEGFKLVSEILLTSKISDTKRLAEIIAQSKSRLQSSLSSAGHVVSAIRSMAYFSKYAYYMDATTGIEYYDEICKMDAKMSENPQAVVDKFTEIVKKVFCQSRLLIGYTGNAESYTRAEAKIKAFVESLPVGEPAGESINFELQKKNEGFTDASAIQYVSRSGDFAKHGYEYTGALQILKMILSYDYMWINIRVKGGAYGCMSSFTRSGETYFTSYRDPNLRKTNEIYDKIPEYLRGFEADEHEMTKYIIGTLGGLDTPLYPEGKGNRSMGAYMRKLTVEDIQKERNEILGATQEDVRGLADMIEAVLSDGNFCVIGNEKTIRSENDMFMGIRSLNE
ncbi:MAG: insulinase family protein [Lachnospiraceae bacterium]|nr:insulinase family protein [Lachnospiraceae bacterium]